MPATKRTTKRPPGYNLKPKHITLLRELARQDCIDGASDKPNMSATLYRVLRAELQRRKAAQFPGDRELQREKEMSK